ncbi:MAG: VWA domain-containing protein [Planctomycetota bacterium]
MFPGILTLILAANLTAACCEERASEACPPSVEIVICLDTSGSMNGLIDAARQKLWAIVNDLALAEPAPKLRVALLTYGNNGHEEENGWVKLETPFTDDLDLISERLFALTTNGGTELVGRVLKASLDRLDWSPGERALKLILVAGNESADQDRVIPYRDTCRAAIARGIIVNPIYCGRPADGIAPGWREIATLSDGHFAAIDQNEGTVVISTPFDEPLAALSAALNDTYIPLGRAGELGAANQVRQDENAEGLNRAAASQRGATKASRNYICSWDLIDALEKGSVKLEDVKEEDLPEELRAMELEELAGHVDKMKGQRAVLRKEISELSSRRESYVKEEMAKQALPAQNGFDHAVRAAIRAQAGAKGYRFGEEDTGQAPASRSAAEAQKEELLRAAE